MLKSIRHIDYVVLLCRDLAVMKDFYTNIMGFTIELDTGSWVEMRVGSTRLTLAQRGRPFEGPPVPSGAACVQLAFRVTPQEVHSCFDELKAKRVEIIEPPTDKDMSYWQHRTLFFKDPEGNILEIYADIELSPDGQRGKEAP
ncbi:MAG: VOC family protein [Chloroflexota bacterium]